MMKLKRVMLLMLCLILASVSVAAAQDSGGGEATMTPDDACLQKGGNMTDGQCVLSATVNISVQYPLDLAQNDFVASTIDPYIQTAKNDFLQVIEQGFNPGSAQYALDLQYDLVQHSDDVVSLVYSIYDYTGGANGMSYYKTFTFNLAAGELVTLDDLFQPNSDYLAVIDPLVEQSLTDQLGDMVDTSWIHDGTGENPENYQHFSLDTDSLTFYFDKYQVAAGAVGTPSVTIPLSQLSDVLAPEYAS